MRAKATAILAPERDGVGTTLFGGVRIGGVKLDGGLTLVVEVGLFNVRPQLPQKMATEGSTDPQLGQRWSNWLSAVGVGGGGTSRCAVALPIGAGGVDCV